MIQGRINARREAVVDLTVIGPAGREARLEFVVGTGYDSGITLPSTMVAALELPRVSAGRAVLGDGSVTAFPICEAVLTWGGVLRRVLVDVAETEPLLGMDLLEDHELRVEVVHGGQVHITPLTET